MLTKELVAASTVPLVLSVLTEGENYGYALIQRVRELSGGRIEWTEGMLYPVLHWMESGGPDRIRMARGRDWAEAEVLPAAQGRPQGAARRERTVDERPRNPYHVMENASEFDLNIALSQWLERFGQSPQLKSENLKELESHVRDSVDQLQTRGLSPEESFLIATHRVGSPAKLEPEFAKVNRRPLNLFIHGLILLFFSVCCWFLWGILHFPHMITRTLQGRPLPAFTQLVVSCGAYLAVPPLLAVVYCAYVWMRKSLASSSWMGFFAVTLAILMLLTLPTFIAVFLPVIGFMNQLVAR